jgi:putative PEP-CTERM system histidine kinase
LRLGAASHALNAAILMAHVWILTNLEQTFRSAVGTLRWRIKFVVLGLAVVFGARIYVRSQEILYSVYDPNWPGVESSALLIGCIFLAIAYARTGMAEIEIYPSRAVLRSSLTVLLVGSYLAVVGILAKIVERYGGAESFQFQALIMLAGVAGLAMLLLSDRLRQRLRIFVGRHFSMAQHDSVQIWTEFSRRLASVKDEPHLCSAAARLISETFEVLSVTIWLVDDKEELAVYSSTAAQPLEPSSAASLSRIPAPLAAGLLSKPAPFDLEEINEAWAAELRRLNPTTFPNGGNRWCVPLRTGERGLGAVVLADRVNGAPYSVEGLLLLQCIADQVTSVLLNLRLAEEVARSRELEAFRTMSAFFVHDLKNAAGSLNLMLKNFPVHFDDPGFREDALRGIGNTARRIDDIIDKLSALRQRPILQLVDTDLNRLMGDALERLEPMPGVELETDLHPLRLQVDRDQIRSVVTNLLLNARDAVGPGGRITVTTRQVGESIVLSVSDNGCGISEDFLRNSLFLPFRSTKKNGLGIGMFQSRMIVEAHGGRILVESAQGQGTTFRVSLPAKDSR